MLKVTAPAKINLTLEVLGRRADGFHEIRSVMQALSLYDILGFEPNDKISIMSTLSLWNPEQSLVSKAVRLVQENADCPPGVRIEVTKRIPLVSGLGGDSSDAAATLLGLNEFWEMGLPTETLHQLASRLGSDVPFFLNGGTAIAGGRGEILTEIPSPPRQWVVLVAPDTPPIQGKTKQLYASLKPEHFTDGQITEKLVQDLKSGKAVDPSLLFNTFENVAVARFSRLDVYRKHLAKLDAPHVHLCGSGPTLFTMLEDKAQAEELYHPVSLRVCASGFH